MSRDSVAIHSLVLTIPETKTIGIATQTSAGTTRIVTTITRVKVAVAAASLVGTRIGTQINMTETEILGMIVIRETDGIIEWNHQSRNLSMELGVFEVN